MTLRTSRLARTLTATVIALATLAGPLAAASPAEAKARVYSPNYFVRRDVLRRAAKWAEARVPYSQTGWKDGYRTDCSGFVSMAWGLDQSYVTWTFPEIAKPITRDELLPGDIMLDTVNHVAIFGGWLNSQHTAYTVYEQAGSTGGAIKRRMVYPFWTNPENYKPYRYTGGHNLLAPDSKRSRPLIQTYAGGAPIVPSWAVALNAKPAPKATPKPAPKPAAPKPVPKPSPKPASKPAPPAPKPAPSPAPVAAPKQAPAAPAAPAVQESIGDKPLIVRIFETFISWLTR